MEIKTKVIALLAAGSMMFGVAHADKDKDKDKDNVFVAHLSGDGNVPATGSKAQGQLILKNEDEGGLSYKLVVSNLNDIVVSHIHCAPEGMNGPPGVTLIKVGAPMTVNGVLSHGPILAPNEGNSCGWVTTADIVEAVKAGNAYVNVHTVTYPAGEIRGQIR